MRQSYSLDLRERVVAKYDDGFSYDDVAELFSVHPRTVRRWIKQRDELGHFENRPHGGAPPLALTDEDRAELRRLHEADNDAYRHELAERLAERTGKRVSESTIGRELRKMGLTRKKNTSKQPSRTRPKSRPQDENS
jgi:transposase